jgi:hypothetical protein
VSPAAPSVSLPAVAVPAAPLAAVVWSAFRRGGCRSCLWRPSLSVPGASVAACAWASLAPAAGFARRWASRLGVPCAVRRVPGGWAVSVPVASGAPAAGVLLPLAGRFGGVRGVAAGLAFCGVAPTRCLCGAAVPAGSGRPRRLRSGRLVVLCLSCSAGGYRASRRGPFPVPGFVGPVRPTPFLSVSGVPRV